MYNGIPFFDYTHRSFLCVFLIEITFLKRIMYFVQTWMILMDAPEGSTKAVGGFLNIAFLHLELC